MSNIYSLLNYFQEIPAPINHISIFDFPAFCRLFSLIAQADDISCLYFPGVYFQNFTAALNPTLDGIKENHRFFVWFLLSSTNATASPIMCPTQVHPGVQSDVLSCRVILQTIVKERYLVGSTADVVSLRYKQEYTTKCWKIK